MEKHTYEYRAAMKKQEQKLEVLLLERLQNNAVIEFDINQVKADFVRTKRHEIAHLKNKTK